MPARPIYGFSPQSDQYMYLKKANNQKRKEKKNSQGNRGNYHKRQISNPPTPLPPMFKTAKFQISQRRYQPNLTLPNLT